MGLDQHMWKRLNEESEPEEIAYWRKTRHIQNWMEQVWREQGNTGDFNLVPLPMTHEILDKLEVDIAHNKLQEHDATGFFFGNSDFDEDDKQSLLSTIIRCRKAINEGYKVWYDSWW